MSERVLIYSDFFYRVMKPPADAQQAFPRPGQIKPEQAELVRLCREVIKAESGAKHLEKAAVDSGGACNSCLQYTRWRLKP